MSKGIELDFNRTVHENASHYYDLSKELRKKALKAEEAIKKTEKELKRVKKKEAPKKSVRVKRERKWYERFHWFESKGFMTIAGKDAKQNEVLVSKYFDDEDLFFHADIQGAPATILKKGKDAPESILKEAAQFAASYSSAWKKGLSTVDVYAVERTQVSKEAQGEYIGKGSFVISGKRKWFKNVQLGIIIGIGKGGVLESVPLISDIRFPVSIELKPGDKEKGKVAKEAAREINAGVDDVLSALPSGNFEYRRIES